MSLPLPQSDRKPLHTRKITVNTFARTDGLWDLEAELIDYKAYDFDLQAGGRRKAGEHIHHMLLRVTIDSEFTITEAHAAYEAAPYGNHCSCIAPAYSGLVGLNLLKGFRNQVKLRFGRTAGCTHMTELSYVLPTVAVQTMAGERKKETAENKGDKPKKPFQLEGCHALRLDGPVAKKFYPLWYQEPKTKSNK